MSKSKKIEGYEDYYVTNEGEIISLKYNKKRILKKYINKRGYYYVRLSKNGKAKSKSIHRFVALAFIENPNNYEQVNHIDGNKKNNNVDNLEWCSSHQNMRHAIDTGLCIPPVFKGSNHGMAKLTEDDVIEIKKLIKENKLKSSEIGKIFNVSKGTINHIKSGKTWKHVQI